MPVCERCRAPLPTDSKRCPVCGDVKAFRTTMVEQVGPNFNKFAIPASSSQHHFGATIQEPLAAFNQAANDRLDHQTEAEIVYGNETPRFSPIRRPPMPKLVIMDDGSKTVGEVIRLRKPEFVIGRSEGDVQIEHDPNISTKHVVITRHLIEGRYRWRLTDAGSTNGTFIRVNKAPLASNKTLIIGSWYYKIKMPSEDKSEHLVLKNIVTPTRRYELPAVGGTIGRDPRSTIVIADDEYLCPIHARFGSRDGRWLIQDLESVNGLWIQAKNVWLDQDVEFQIGEQRIHFLLS